MMEQRSECEANSPIFVRGLSRSGGTLMVTLIDSHPSVSMSYELYPTVLDAGLSREEFRLFGKGLQDAESRKDALNLAPTKGLRTYIARAERSGLMYEQLGNLIQQHCDAGMGLDTIKDRFSFIQRCCLVKVKEEGAAYWGAKCNNSFSDYLAMWPSSKFVNIIRDGRDVLSSQLNTGSFKNGPAQLAKSWKNTHRKFRKFMQKHPDHGHEIFYEQLVANPEEELRKVFAFLGLQFDDHVLHHQECDLSLYKSHHLSMPQLVKPINASKVGRWRQDLSQDQLKEFYDMAGGALVELGYEL